MFSVLNDGRLWFRTRLKHVGIRIRKEAGKKVNFLSNGNEEKDNSYCVNVFTLLYVVSSYFSSYTFASKIIFICTVLSNR